MNFANMLQGLVEPQSIINSITYKGAEQIKHRLEVKEDRARSCNRARNTIDEKITFKVSKNIYAVKQLKTDTLRYEVRATTNHVKSILYSGNDLNAAITARDLHFVTRTRRTRPDLTGIPRGTSNRKGSNKVVGKGIFEIYYSGVDTPIYRAYITRNNVKELLYEGVSKIDAIEARRIAEINKPKLLKLSTEKINLVKATQFGIKNLWTVKFGYRYIVETGRGDTRRVHYYGSDINAAMRARGNYELSR